MKDQNTENCDMIEYNAFNNIHQAVMVIDKDFNIITMNKAACALRNRKNKKFKKCYLFSHNSDTPCWEKGLVCPVREAIETKEFTRTVHKHIYDGKEVFEEITATPVLDENGEVMYVIEELRDISKLLKLETIITSLRNELKILQGLLPICASCKKIKDDGGYWKELETYIADRSDAKFSHSICPDCLRELYPDIAKKMDEKRSSGKN
ncbi:MAG: PAS domain-containing protein [Candidatus Delongbacteria bacterium]